MRFEPLPTPARPSPTPPSAHCPCSVLSWKGWACISRPYPRTSSSPLKGPFLALDFIETPPLLSLLSMCCGTLSRARGAALSWSPNLLRMHFTTQSRLDLRHLEPYLLFIVDLLFSLSSTPAPPPFDERKTYPVFLLFSSCVLSLMGQAANPNTSAGEKVLSDLFSSPSFLGKIEFFFSIVHSLFCRNALSFDVELMRPPFR